EEKSEEERAEERRAEFNLEKEEGESRPYRVPWLLFAGALVCGFCLWLFLGKSNATLWVMGRSPWKGLGEGPARGIGAVAGVRVGGTVASFDWPVGARGRASGYEEPAFFPLVLGGFLGGLVVWLLPSLARFLHFLGARPFWGKGWVIQRVQAGLAWVRKR